MHGRIDPRLDLLTLIFWRRKLHHQTVDIARHR